MDLLGFGDDTPAPPRSSRRCKCSLLEPGVTMSGEEYQSLWGSISDAEATVTTVPLNAVPTSTDVVEEALASNNVMTMASGELPTEFKFFLYAKDTSGVLFLLQGNVSKTPGEALMIVTIKSTEQNVSDKIEQLVETLRSSLN